MKRTTGIPCCVDTIEAGFDGLQVAERLTDGYYLVVDIEDGIEYWVNPDYVTFEI